MRLFDAPQALCLIFVAERRILAALTVLVVVCRDAAKY